MSSPMPIHVETQLEVHKGLVVPAEPLMLLLMLMLLAVPSRQGANCRGNGLSSLVHEAGRRADAVGNRRESGTTR